MTYAVLALIPIFVLLPWVYTRDLIHPEPKRTVYKLFLLGAAIVLPAGLLERALLQGRLSVNNGWIWMMATAFLVAGMVEEFLKAAIVEKKALQAGLMRSPIDCIVYSGAVALGFAMIENVLYVTSDGFTTALLRSVTAVPAHLMFGIIMGTAFADSIWGGQNRAWAYLKPAFLHGTYDTFALSSTLVGDLLLFVYLMFLLEWALRSVRHAQETSLAMS